MKFSKNSHYVVYLRMRTRNSSGPHRHLCMRAEAAWMPKQQPFRDRVFHAGSSRQATMHNADEIAPPPRYMVLRDFPKTCGGRPQGYQIASPPADRGDSIDVGMFCPFVTSVLPSISTIPGHFRIALIRCGRMLDSLPQTIALGCPCIHDPSCRYLCLSNARGS